MEAGYETPEEAARGDIPARYAQTLAMAVSPDETTAIVMLGTNEEPLLYPYQVVCRREGDRWFDEDSSNGNGGWGLTSTNEDGVELYMHWLIDEAPVGAVAVVVTYQDEEHQIPVLASGYFVFSAWNVSLDSCLDDDPRVIRVVRGDGIEEPVVTLSNGISSEQKRAMMRLLDEAPPDEARQWIEFLPDDESW